MTRSNECPICTNPTNTILNLSFGTKIGLPSTIPLNNCDSCNFQFNAVGSQEGYNQYYSTNVSIPIKAMTIPQVGYMGKQLRNLPIGAKVLDFGCGTGLLLSSLARLFPHLQFVGFDLSLPTNPPNIPNLTYRGFSSLFMLAPFDYIIMSHVLEHMIDFTILRDIHSLLSESGSIYLEVPDATAYSQSLGRREFLYYYDRLHVNHFSPFSIHKLFGTYGFYMAEVDFHTFLYSDYGKYPALVVLLHKGNFIRLTNRDVPLMAVFNQYLEYERERATHITYKLSQFPKIIVWGTGDNYHRSLENDGPLSKMPKDKMLLTDSFGTSMLPPHNTIKGYPYPVVVTVSNGRQEIHRQILNIDANREVIHV